MNLYNQGKTYKQITGMAKVSPRNIKPVLEKAEKEGEKGLGINTQEGNNGILETAKHKEYLPSVKHTACFRR